MSNPSKHFVSIIIPTYKDWSRLSLCLNALLNQSYNKDSFEIIVVNNNPTDIVPVGYILPDNCILIEESSPGSYAARNAALKLSRGVIIGFTDSDCIPDKDWIKNAVTFFHLNSNYTRIAGNITLFYKSSKLTPAELYEKVYAFKQEGLSRNGLSVTANMFVYKFVFNKIGLFNDNLLSGGDYEWAIRARDAGFQISYRQDVNVFHPARYKVAELKTKAKRTAGKTKLNKLDAIQNMLRTFIPPARSIYRAIMNYNRELSLYEKLTVFVIYNYLAFIHKFESLRISFGKEANRI